MIPQRALDFIISYEAFVGHPYWPGGNSGITLDYGYDLAHHTELDLRHDWLEEGRIARADASEISGLLAACGKAGGAAQQRLAGVRRVNIRREDAAYVFNEISIPKYEGITQRAFPGCENLPELAYGALVSLVYNRGGSMGTEGTPSWDSRREMREIRAAVAEGDLPEIAQAIRRMKRLWEGKNLDGLLKRRDAEADMVEEA